MKVFFMMLLFSVMLWAQTEDLEKRGNRIIQPNFYQEILNFSVLDSNKTRVDVFIQIPYSEIKFAKADNGFTASYTVTVTVFDEEKVKLVTEKIWSEKVETADFDQTTTRNNSCLSLKSFELNPATYMFRIAIEDKESGRTFTSENKIIVRKFNKRISMSDIVLIAKQNPSGKSNSILPNISRNAATQKDGLPMFFEAYSDSARQVKIDFVISGKNDKPIYTVSEKRDLAKGKNQILYTIKIPSLPLGQYTLNVEIKDSLSGISDKARKVFFSRWTSVPTNIKDLDKAIEEMVYIANGDQIKYIKEAPNENEKVKRFMEFWKKRDPSPSTEENEFFDEYYGRVAFANANFTHYTEGWRTDRGMIYILLGAPSNIDRHPFDYNAKPYEIWQYYELNKEYIFLDSTGFGDYRLISPLDADTYRYRY